MSFSCEERFDSSISLKQDQWTKNALETVPTSRGVLLFADADQGPVQLLQAANLRRTATARLVHTETDSPSRKADVSDVTAAVYYASCYNPFLTQLTYAQLAHAIFPKYTDNCLQLPRISFATIDTHSFLPYFYISDRLDAVGKTDQCGLFPTRKAAAEFCEILNTIFVLCRNPALLNSGREQSCSYLQMQSCPGPCLNDAFRAPYANAVKQAIQTVSSGTETAKQQLRQKMQRASDQMDFERAQQCKKKLDQLNRLTRHDFRYVSPLQEFCLLHIDTGPKIKIEGQNRKQQQLMWFKVTAQGVFHVGEFVPETKNSIAAFLEANWLSDKNPLPLKDNKELLSLVSLQLFRSQRSGVWIDCSKGIWMDTITSALTERFELAFPNSA